MTRLLRLGLLGLISLLFGTLQANAVHLMGGEITYRYLDSNGAAATPWRYEVTARIYFNPVTDPGSESITLDFREQGRYYDWRERPMLRVKAQRSSLTEITLPALPGCSQTVPRVSLALYVVTVELPATPAGFKAICDIAARTIGITNIASNGTESMSLDVVMQPATTPNSSPVFSTIPVALICLNENSVILNNAFDADGDELRYQFFKSQWPTYVLNYAPGYSESKPFGADGAATVDAKTGLSQYLSRRQGSFQMLVEVQEFRKVNGQDVMLSSVRREMQLIVRPCSGMPNQPPAFTAASLVKTDFEIQEGQALEFAVGATDPDGRGLTLTASSALLDGAGPAQATFNGDAGRSVSGNPAGYATVKGTGSVTGTFQLAGCGMARPEPYDVVLTATDEECNAKSVVASFRVKVVGTPFPARVVGVPATCGQSVATYSVEGPAYGSYQWTVNGGQIIGPATGKTVEVLWGNSPTGAITVKGVPPAGCPTAGATMSVVLTPGLPPIKGPLTYCARQNTGLQYTVEGPAANYRWSISDGSIVSGQGTNSVEVDLVRNATAILRVTNPDALRPCVTALRIGPDDACLAFFNVITPNGDGLNDVFVIENVERHPNTKLTIYTRWGNKLYEATNYQNTYRGEGASAGLYYYLCQLTDGTTYKGWFEVVR